MGHIRESIGRVSIESRRTSFVIHTNYGYTPDGNKHSDDLGSFGVHWRESPHPEFLRADLDDLIAALVELRDSNDQN